MSEIKDQLSGDKSNKMSTADTNRADWGLKRIEQWKASTFEENMQDWQRAYPDYKFFNIDPNTVIEKNDANAPNLPPSFIDTLMGLAKLNKEHSANLPGNIKKMRVYDGGSLISIRLEDNMGNFTHIYFESIPPFYIRDLIKKDNE